MFLFESLTETLPRWHYLALDRCLELYLIGRVLGIKEKQLGPQIQVLSSEFQRPCVIAVDSKKYTL